MVLRATKFFPMVFGHIFVILWMTNWLIDQRMRDRNFCSNSIIRQSRDKLSSQVFQNRQNLGWLSTNTIAIATQFHGTITVQLADFVDRDWFSMVLHGRNFCSNSKMRRQRDKRSLNMFHSYGWNQIISQQILAIFSSLQI